MRSGVLISATLHLVVIVLAVAGLPVLFDSDRPPEMAVVVEVVSLEQKPAPREKPKPKPKPAPRKKPKPAPRQAKAPPAAPPPDADEVVPPEPMPEAKPKPVAKPKPEPPPIRLKPPVKKAAAAPKPRHKPKPPAPDPLKSLLRNLQKQKQQAIEREEVEKRTMRDLLAAAMPPPPEPRPSSIDGLREAAALKKMVMRQITPCWNVPAGLEDVHKMRVDVRIFLNPDGTLRGAPRVEDVGRLSRDRAFRSLAESALRALRNPRCSPLRLPIRMYESWREISFNFDPRGIVR